MVNVTSSLVSIVVPCYNQATFLNEALDSVSAQTYKNWECIIINDGSTDHTDDVAQFYCNNDSRFKCIKTENKGLSSSRNTGIKNAAGDFIQLLDADDLIERHKLHTQINYYQLDNMDNNTIVYSSMRYFENENPSELQILGRDNFIAHIELIESDSLNSQKELLKARNPFVISASLYPKKLFKDIGNFDENLSALEDWDFHIRCVYGGFKFHHLYGSQSRTLIRMHDQSMMRNQKLLDDNFYKLILKHDLRKIEIAKKETLLKKIMREMAPPVIVKLVKKLISKS